MHDVMFPNIEQKSSPADDLISVASRSVIAK